MKACCRVRSFPWSMVWNTQQTYSELCWDFSETKPHKKVLHDDHTGTHCVWWNGSKTVDQFSRDLSTMQCVHICFRLSSMCAEVHNDDREVHSVRIPLLPAPGSGQVHHKQELQVRERLFVRPTTDLLIHQHPPPWCWLTFVGFFVAEFTCSFPWTMSTSWVPLLPWRHF